MKIMVDSFCDTNVIRIEGAYYLLRRLENLLLFYRYRINMYGRFTSDIEQGRWDCLRIQLYDGADVDMYLAHIERIAKHCIKRHGLIIEK